jgi:hypothetical protein
LPDFAGTNFKFEHVGSAHRANTFDIIVADIRLRAEELSSLFKNGRAATK